MCDKKNGIPLGATRTEAPEVGGFRGPQSQYCREPLQEASLPSREAQGAKPISAQQLFPPGQLFSNFLRARRAVNVAAVECPVKVKQGQHIGLKFSFD